jgi:hypothetical protein
MDAKCLDPPHPLPSVIVCPRCQRPMHLVRTWRRRCAVGGGLTGAALALHGARSGAAVGSGVLPGIGSVVGIVTGALLGAAAGAAAGEVVDRDIIASYRCLACGCRCRLND